MSEISTAEVKSWFQNSEDLYDLELTYLSKGDIIEMDTVPAGYELKMVAQNTEREYDSYGNSHLEDGYIVFSVTNDEGESREFKMPLSYASYEGWEYKVNSIAPTSKHVKTVTVWEWT